MTDRQEPVRRTQLSAAKQALVEKRLKTLAAQPAADMIPRRPDPSRAPLSFPQRRAWRAYVKTGESTFYLRAIRMNGALDHSLIERSLNELLSRHESLRTVFDYVGDRPSQVILPPRPASLPLVDLSGLPDEARLEEAHKLASQEAGRQVDLTLGPVLRISLLRLSRQDHIALIVVSHMVCDRWSLGILIEEFATLYRSFYEGRRSPLPDLPIQFGDFAHWQTELLRGDYLDKLTSYWKKQLHGSPLATPLVTDRRRPAVENCRGAGRSVTVDRTLADGLKALSRSEGVTLFIVMLTLFKVLLCRYTSSFDVVIQSPIANRTRKEFERLIGGFVNTLLIRTDLSGDPTFRESVGRVREVAYEAYGHQDMPYEKIRAELKPPAGNTHLPLYDVVFVLHTVPLGTLDLPGLSLSQLSVAKDRVNFDLLMDISYMGRDLMCSLKYKTDLFDPETISLMLRNYVAFAETFVGDPDLRILSLPLLDGSN